jgi:hypothetical protein
VKPPTPTIVQRAISQLWTAVIFIALFPALVVMAIKMFSRLMPWLIGAGVLLTTASLLGSAVVGRRQGWW